MSITNSAMDDLTHNLEELLLLFDRPMEPIYMPKGEELAIIDIPNDYLQDGDDQIISTLSDRFDTDHPKVEHLSIANIDKPDIAFASQLGRMDQFSLFVPHHKDMASSLIDVFLAAKDAKQLMAWAVYAHDRVNPLMFNYALSVAMLNRHDTKEMAIPNFAETFPDKYVDSQVLVKARAEVSLNNKGNREPIEIPRDNTGADHNPEHRIAYFREDIGINLHHWHWHLVYPNGVSDRSIVAKDRRGELFYYMHHQILARYNFERLSNNLNRTSRLNDLRAPIEEGYFSKLDSHVAGRGWPARADNTVLENVIREVDNLKVDISDLERWRDRILEAIAEGFVRKSDGTRIELDEKDGIDILGDIIESSTLTVNKALYGDLHNMGHVLLAFAHDPKHKHMESFGMMGDFATAMRDPVFYRWHAYLDDIFYKFKGTLPSYEMKHLIYEDINISSFDISVTSNEYSEEDAEMFHTFWQKSDVDLSRGMDFAPRGSVFARFTHLQHEDYTYNITVNNNSKTQKLGTCRIFIGPKFNERGQPFLLRDLCLMMVEMDKFVVKLEPGENHVIRKSIDSSITIPFERTYRNLNKGRGAAGSEQEAKFNFCGCGWPHNMLVPRGKPEGMPVYIYVLISDHLIDKIDQDEEGECHDAASFCGLRDRRYPDTRSMGYPFDRLPRDKLNYIEDFITPNSRLFETKIKYTDVTRTVKNIKKPNEEVSIAKK